MQSTKKHGQRMGTQPERMGVVMCDGRSKKSAVLENARKNFLKLSTSRELTNKQEKLVGWAQKSPGIG